MTLGICVGGVSGWTGSAIAQAVLDDPELELSGAVARRCKGKDAGQVIGRTAIGLPVVDSVEAALEAGTSEVYIDYTHPSSVKVNVLAALNRGVPAIVGTSGLSAADYAEIAEVAEARGLGVVASGNFSITAALLQHFAVIAAQHVPDFEIIDYAKSTKPDVPSGTARELAERLGAIAPSNPGVPLDKIIGPKETRGANISGGRVHSVRLPSYVLAVEAIFGKASERLALRHDAGTSAEPYVSGTLLAARRVREIKGLVRGLDTLLFGEAQK
ncbi:4-hydroxy-tetrahydrodipicolinate reductase [Dongia deserti]|uniref:4-hydroxy-tetrahydrodipicolinate reductase n=1 Tax=Dongia deserti TaxID=2268030 RepID=UPI000E64679E|nr:4-hydroxy-tetrahydrodipicolinate reductase [Dongia deserti]